MNISDSINVLSKLFSQSISHGSAKIALDSKAGGKKIHATNTDGGKGANQPPSINGPEKQDDVRGIERKKDVFGFSVQLPSNRLITPEFGREILMKDLEVRIANNLDYPYEKCLELTIVGTNHQVCAVAQTSAHILHLISILWRNLTIGDGNADPFLANPGASLRIHSFATLLHSIGASTFISENGASLVDVVGNWDVATLSKILASRFDEKALVGSEAVQVLDEAQWLKAHEDNEPDSGSKPDTEKTKRHLLQSFEDLNAVAKDVPATESKGDHTTAGTDGKDEIIPGTSTTTKTTDFNCKSVWSYESGKIPLTFEDEPEPEPEPEPEQKVNVDSMADFRSALRTAFSDDDGDGFANDCHNKSTIASDSHNTSTIQVTDGLSGGRVRLPSRELFTIRETTDDELDRKMILSEIPPITTESPEKSSAISSDDSDVLLDKIKNSVKQFRRPVLKKTRDLEGATMPPQEELPCLEIARKLTYVPNMDQIEQAGEKFLETLGENFRVSNLNQIGEEDGQVAKSRHKRTLSRASTDWSVIVEPHQALREEEKGTRTKENEVIDKHDSFKNLNEIGGKERQIEKSHHKKTRSRSSIDWADIMEPRQASIHEEKDTTAKEIEVINSDDSFKNLNQIDGEERRVGSSRHKKTRSRSSIDWSHIMEPRKSPMQAEIPRPEIVKKQRSVPNTEEIEEAGAKILNSLGENFGVSNLNQIGGEESRVGSSHHRKTRSRSSVDWSVIVEPSHAPIQTEKGTPNGENEVIDTDDSMLHFRKKHRLQSPSRDLRVV